MMVIKKRRMWTHIALAQVGWNILVTLGDEAVKCTCVLAYKIDLI